MTGDSPSRPQPPQPGTRQEVATAHAGTGPPGPGDCAVLEQAFSRDSLYQLRAAVAAHAAQAGVPSGRTHDVVLAVYELVSNVIRHGSGHGRMRIWKNEHILYCQVIAGEPAPGAATGAEGGATDPAPWPVRPGHGLWLVKRLADQVTFQPGSPSCATISFSLDVPGTAGE